MIDKIIEENMALIYGIAKKYQAYHDMEDLVQAGIIGLINACNHFDSSRDTKLSTFAYTYIMGEIKQYIYKDKGLKVSRNIINLNSRVEKTREILAQELMREPTTEEIALTLEMAEEEISDSINATYLLESLDNDDYPLHELIGESKDNDTLIMLKSELDKLPEENKQLIIARYFNDLSQQETAKLLGISQVQVSRKESKTLELLNRKMAA